MIEKIKPNVVIITLNWNRREDTIECVESLLRLNYDNYTVVVVDNASTDGSVQAIRAAFPGVKIIENESNLGYALGFNTGIKYALDRDPKYILILNNDTKIDRNALDELVKVAESDEEIGFVSGKVYEYDEPNKLQVVGKVCDFNRGLLHNIGHGEIDHGQYDKITEYEFLDDVFWLARAEVFRKVGMYDPNFFLYFEETDLCARTNKHFKLVFTPYAKIWHKGSQSSGGLGSPTQAYYMARNGIIFMYRNSSRRQFLSFLLYFLSVKMSRSIAGYIVYNKFSSMLQYIKGSIAGMRWVIENTMSD
jgi:GT2 family glycosyltransferase